MIVPQMFRHSHIRLVIAFAATLALSACDSRTVTVWLDELSGRIAALMPWHEPQITGEWHGFVRLTATATTATLWLKQAGDTFSGELRPEPYETTYPVTGTFRERRFEGAVKVTNDTCTGMFRLSGELERDYLRLTGSGELCGLKDVTLRSDFRRTSFTGTPPLLETPPADSPPLEPLWNEGPIPSFPVAWDIRPFVSAVTDAGSGAVTGFRLEIPAMQNFPTVTRCERVAPPEELCMSEGGMVPDERPQWPQDQPSFLDWAVLDLDRIAQSGPALERIVFPTAGAVTADTAFALQQLIGSGDDRLIQVPAALETLEPGELLTGAVYRNRYFREILLGDFRPQLFVRELGFSHPIVMARGSVPLTDCDFTRRCRAEQSLGGLLQKLDLAEHPNLVMVTRLRTTISRPWFRRPYLARSPDGTFSVRTSFHPPERTGTGYPVYSAVSATPLTRADIRIDFPQVTLQRDDENRLSRLGVRISVAQIVNGMHVAAPRFPSVAEAEVQFLEDSCISARMPVPARARDLCPGLLDPPVTFRLKIPPNPDVPANPSRDGAVDLSRKTWPGGTATWTEKDWVSLNIRVEGAPGFSVTESYLYRAKDLYPSAESMLRFVATPRLIDFVSTRPESFRYQFEGVLVSSDRINLTLNPRSHVRITHISIPAADLSVKDGYITVSTPGMAILRFSHPDFPVIPAEIAVWSREKGSGPASPGRPSEETGH